MRRLTPRRPFAGRLAEERGAVLVLVALLMVPLLGIGAIAIDVAALHSDRTQLRNGADAAALAVALDCARGNCGNKVDTATKALTANTVSARAEDAAVATPAVTVSPDGRKVTVGATAAQTHWFAPVLGVSSSQVTASATATWAPTTRGRANFPLAISWCEYQAQIAQYPLTNTASHRISGKTEVGGTCTGPTGAPITSGYAVTTPDDNSVCRTTSTLGSTVAWYPGMYSGGLPATCSNAYLASLIGSDILFPVWDYVTNTASGPQIHVMGYAAFHIMGYDVQSSDPALFGWFTYAAQMSDATTNTASSATDFGARSVYLQG